MDLRIAPCRPRDVDAARAVVREVCAELFGCSPPDFDDMDRLVEEYGAPLGVFLVLLDGDSVVGTGGIRRIDAATGELKRMYFLPAYRGRGFGCEMAQKLLEFARSAGYDRVRLETSPQLAAANRLYRRLGFSPIERYTDGPCTTFMERVVQEHQP